MCLDVLGVLTTGQTLDKGNPLHVNVHHCPHFTLLTGSTASVLKFCSNQTLH
jgi:hypothetical protein